VVAAHAEPEEHGGTVDIRELRPLGDLSRAAEQLERVSHAARLRQCPRLAEQRAQLEIDRTGGGDGAAAAREHQCRLGVLALLGERLAPGERGRPRRVRAPPR
jgi:hypothetical protein